jgi:hypothetical protein
VTGTVPVRENSDPLSVLVATPLEVSDTPGSQAHWAESELLPHWRSGYGCLNWPLSGRILRHAPVTMGLDDIRYWWKR